MSGYVFHVFFFFGVWAPRYQGFEFEVKVLERKVSAIGEGKRGGL